MRIHKKLKGSIPAHSNGVTNFKIVDQALVDGNPWFTVQVHPDIRSWIYSQPEAMWQQHIDSNWYTVANTFDVHEKLYMIIALRWS